MNHRNGRNRHAFSLIEVMISVALMLALMIGVNYVFSSVGKATGMTQAVSRVTRDMQGAHSVLYRDFSTADMTNAPCIVVRSFSTKAFASRQDYLGAIDQGDPLNDTDSTGATLTHLIGDVDSRIHRTDLLMFFSRDTFARQTGDFRYLDDMSCQEAMLWYGHLNLPDDSGVFSTTTNPGAGASGTNPNNFFASQWILGRLAILLQEPLAGNITTYKYVPSFTATNHQYIRGSGSSLDPLAHDSAATTSGYTLEQSRYDLAGTSMGGYKQILTNYLASNPAGHWWDSMMSGWRFQARPFVLGAAGQRLSPADVALQAPIFLSNCTQFAVEFAGDFVRQNPSTGAFIDAVPDGEIDYYMPGAGKPKQIRWYGYPRNTSDPTNTLAIKASEGDVVPVRDFASAQQTFERELPTTTAQDYQTIAYPSSGAPPIYTCAWGPSDTNRPSLFRIVISVDDPNGRFAEPLTFEYVFKVQ